MRRRPEPFRALIVALGLNPLQGFVGPLLPEAPCGSSKRAGGRSPVASRWVAMRTRWSTLEPRMPRIYQEKYERRSKLVVRGNRRLMFAFSFRHDETDSKIGCSTDSTAEQSTGVSIRLLLAFTPTSLRREW